MRTISIILYRKYSASNQQLYYQWKWRRGEDIFLSVQVLDQVHKTYFGTGFAYSFSKRDYLFSHFLGFPTLGRAFLALQSPCLWEGDNVPINWLRSKVLYKVLNANIKPLWRKHIILCTLSVFPLKWQRCLVRRDKRWTTDTLIIEASITVKVIL